MNTIGNATAAYYARSTGQLADLRRSAERMQEQLATGERLGRASDDPAAAARLRLLGRADRLAAVHRENAARAASDLQLASDALGRVGDDLIRVRELAVQAGNGTLPVEAREAIGLEIAQLRSGIIAAANTRDAYGNPLFAGEGAAAYTLSAAGDAAYAGTAEAGELDLGEGQGVKRGVTGPQFMTFASGGGQVDLPAFLKDLSETLRSGGGTGASIAALDDALDNLSRTQTVVGARLAWVEMVQDRQVAAEEARAQATADTGGVDFAATVARLQQILTALEASQAGFARLSALSLFNSI